MKKFIEIIKKKWLRDTTKTVILVIVLIALFILINLGVQKLELTDIDVTDTGLYSLTDTSKDQIKDIDQEVLISFFGVEESSSVVDLVKQYKKANENITYEITTVDARPDLKSTYGLTESDSAIVIQSGDSYKILSTSDLYTYDYTTYEYIDVTEQKLTNAIMGVTIENPPTIYFLTGHEEYSISSNFTILAGYLENEVNNVSSLDLLTSDGMPEDCSALVIPAPAKDFTEYEAGLIIEYINSGGKILWLGEYIYPEEELPNVQKVLDQFGVTVENGIVLEQNANRMVTGYASIILPDISYTDITTDLMTDGGVAFLEAARLSFASDEKLEELGVTNQTLLSSSKDSFFRTDFTISTTSLSSSDEEGAQTLGALLTKTIDDDTTSQMVIFSDALFATDYYITISSQTVYLIQLYNNVDLVLNSISYLTEREDTITIRKDTSVVTFTTTEAQDRNIKIIIFGVPVLIIIAGIVVWQIRRRKR